MEIDLFLRDVWSRFYCASSQYQYQIFAATIFVSYPTVLGDRW